LAEFYLHWPAQGDYSDWYNWVIGNKTDGSDEFENHNRVSVIQLYSQYTSNFRLLVSSYSKTKFFDEALSNCSWFKNYVKR
jgi:hypothetical protein